MKLFFSFGLKYWSWIFISEFLLQVCRSKLFKPGAGKKEKKSKKTRKQALLQEKTQSSKKKNLLKKTRSRPRNDQEKKKEHFFLDHIWVGFLVESMFSWQLSFFLELVFFSWMSACFLGRVRVFLFSYFLFFLSLL